MAARMAALRLLVMTLLSRCVDCGIASAVLLFSAGQAFAAVVCTGPGYPPGCVEVHAAPARAYGRPVAAPGGAVLNPSPGVGYGAAGAGLRPAAGPGVGPNAGGPVNRVGAR